MMSNQTLYIVDQHTIIHIVVTYMAVVAVLTNMILILTALMTPTIPSLVG